MHDGGGVELGQVVAGDVAEDDADRPQQDLEGALRLGCVPLGARGRQHPDLGCAELLRLEHGDVRAGAAVDQDPAVAAHRREDPRQRRARQERREELAVGEHDGVARGQVGGDDVHGDLQVLEARHEQVVADPPLEPVRRDEVVAPAGDAEEERARSHREDQAPGRLAPHVAERHGPDFVRRGADVGRVERADRGADQEVGSHPAGEQRLQHAGLRRPQGATTGQDECAHCRARYRPDRTTHYGRAR
jgi:hypothetical protein